MKNVRLFPAFVAIVFAFSCNRNPEEQRSKVIIEDKTAALIEEKQEIIKQEKSNSYAFVPKPETEEISVVKPASKNQKNITKKIKQLPKSELNLEKAEAEISGNIYDIFKSFEKPFQTFTFLPQKDTVLIGLEGTTLKVNANSFVTESSNKQVSGPIEIKLKEYYSIGDILLANLSTKAGNEMLETGGMIYLEAFSGNEKLKLNKASQIEIGFPFQNKKEGMQTFNGEWKNDIIEWIPADTSNLSVYEYVDVMPTFPGGESTMLSYINSNLKYPSKAQKEGIQGLVVLNFIVLEDGSLSDFNVLSSVSPEVDNEALRVIKSMPKWTPGLKNKKIVSTRYTLPVRFSIDGVKKKYTIERPEDRITGLFQTGTKINNKEFAKKFEKVNQDSIESASITSMSLYLISTSKLGWINCDRFNYSKSNLNFAVTALNSSDQNVKIIFHKIRSILQGVPEANRYLFHNVPKNEKITIIALKKVGNKPYLAIKETTTSNLIESNLIYEKVTLEKLKEEMSKLNKLN